MDIGDAVLIPDTVIVFDVAAVLSATPVWSVKVNGSGVVSGHAGVVALAALLYALWLPALSTAETAYE